MKIKTHHYKKKCLLKNMKYPLVETSPDRTEFILELDENIKGGEYRYDFVEMGEMIEYTPISKANMGLIKFDSKKPHILEFDIDPQDRGFTQNMVGGQIVIPNMYKITAKKTQTIVMWCLKIQVMELYNNNLKVEQQQIS